ncbi:YceI family protein [Parendozoicomonas sp. Alg238-R29]|uniref:YceI family protein n=1 Tax=Parendozoicomonas sp. Alg238-R29 TaxID=2993446 RepID=UPI00248E7700|nr:YceI family protein [Parendozoicomonas sp. Alg238-R29]
MKNFLQAALVAAALTSASANAADYVIDTEGAHAFVQFKIKHLGYSWLVGRFNTFEGGFSYNADKPEDSTINVTIQTASIDSNHAERDKHLRGEDFLDVDEFPEATFASTGFTPDEDGLSGTLEGTLTLHGVTKTITFPVKKIGEGDDPWGGYRAGFEGQTTLKLADYGITYNLGPASTEVQLDLLIEGIRK